MHHYRSVAIVMTSTPYPVPKDGNLPSIYKSEIKLQSNNNDIIKCLSSWMQGFSRIASIQLAKEAIETLASEICVKSDGCFQYARFAFEALVAQAKVDSNADLHETVKEFPRGVHRL